MKGKVNNDLHPRPSRAQAYMTGNPRTIGVDKEDDESKQARVAGPKI